MNEHALSGLQSRERCGGGGLTLANAAHCNGRPLGIATKAIICYERIVVVHVGGYQRHSMSIPSAALITKFLLITPVVIHTLSLPCFGYERG